MSRELIVLLIRVFPVTLIFPASVAVLILAKTILISTIKFFSNICNGFYSCYGEAISQAIINPKTWKFLLLFWLIGVVLSYGTVYKDLRHH
jgi:hypothetical protein